MKVIDLLNKIANGELQDATKFKYNGDYFRYWKGLKQFDKYTDYHYSIIEFCDDNLFNISNLNDEIEIIEDTPKEDKKIEKVDFFELRENIKAGISNDTYLACFINEIIDKVNGE